MSAPGAIRGTFSDFRIVKGRKVAQLVIELPIEQADDALTVLGGLPRSDADRWVALARLKETPVAAGQDEEADSFRAPHASPQATQEASSSAPRKAWADLPPSQQAAMRCSEQPFRDYLAWRFEDGPDLDPQGAAEAVRSYCGGIESRRELDTNHKARVLWHQLDRSYMEATGRLAVSR